MFGGDFIEPDDILELSSLSKNIQKMTDIKGWVESPAYHSIEETLELLNQSVISISRNTPHFTSDATNKLLKLLDDVHSIMEQIEPTKQIVRFGNKAFRVFLTKLWNSRFDLFRGITDEPECMEYFCQSFGSWTRLDYGTGHEFNFLAFITSLFLVNVLKPEDCQAIVLDVFWNYWTLINEIQDRYQLEPAGSHGSWGADDYVALPFVFGSAQLIDHQSVTPSNVIDRLISAEHKDENSYCRWIDFIYKVKRGEFIEHSRLLYSLRTQPHFYKINVGMLKMYKGEIMNQFLVVQHFRFGTVLKWE